jgi:hypothetical protein
MSSRKKQYNRQQSTAYSSPFDNRIPVKRADPVHTDFIKPPTQTSNEMIFRYRPPDIVELFEGKTPEGNLYFDGVWSGQFFPLQGPEDEEQDDDDFISADSNAGGQGKTGSSRVIRNDFAIENRRTDFRDEKKKPPVCSDQQGTHFRVYGSSMALQERYSEAIRKSWERGQTQEMLLRRVRSKLSEKIESYGAHRIRMRKKFEYFDTGKKRSLHELEFRLFLDETNCFLDEVESLALFAYLDVEETGNITWKSFEQYCLVRDASAGVALLPKAITGQR